MAEESLASLGEGEDLVHHRLQVIGLDCPIHGFEMDS